MVTCSVAFIGFVKGLERLQQTFSLRPLGTRLSWDFAKAGAAIDGMAAPCLGRAQRSSPKARRVAPALAERGLDGDSACQATICVAMSWSCEKPAGKPFPRSVSAFYDPPRVDANDLRGARQEATKDRATSLYSADLEGSGP
jgi:hypothetical protein